MSSTNIHSRLGCNCDRQSCDNAAGMALTAKSSSRGSHAANSRHYTSGPSLPRTPLNVQASCQEQHKPVSPCALGSSMSGGLSSGHFTATACAALTITVPASCTAQNCRNSRRLRDVLPLL